MRNKKIEEKLNAIKLDLIDFSSDKILDEDSFYELEDICIDYQRISSEIDMYMSELGEFGYLIDLSLERLSKIDGGRANELRETLVENGVL